MSKEVWACNGCSLWVVVVDGMELNQRPCSIQRGIRVHNHTISCPVESIKLGFFSKSDLFQSLFTHLHFLTYLPALITTDVFAKHSQTGTVPTCPPGTTKLWEGYSLMFLGDNFYQTGQDLGRAGSCMKDAPYIPFFHCEYAGGDEECYYTGLVPIFQHSRVLLLRCKLIGSYKLGVQHKHCVVFDFVGNVRCRLLGVLKVHFSSNKLSKIIAWYWIIPPNWRMDLFFYSKGLLKTKFLIKSFTNLHQRVKNFIGNISEHCKRKVSNTIRSLLLYTTICLDLSCLPWYLLVYVAIQVSDYL